MSYFYATLNRPYSEMIDLEKIFDVLAGGFDHVVGHFV